MKTFYLRDKKGFLLPLVIIYTIIAMIVGTGILLLGSLERIEAAKRLHREEAFYLAEAGINYAYYKLKEDASWLPDEGSFFSLGAGTFQLKAETNGDTVTITSTGMVKGHQEKVAATFQKGGGGIFASGIFGTTDVIVNNNSLIDSYDSRLGPYGGSNIGSEGNTSSNLRISVSNNGKIKGDAAVGTGNPSDIYVGNNGEITGNRIYDASERTLDPVTIPGDLLSLSYPSWGDPRIQPSGSYTLSGGVLSVSKNKTITISSGSFRFKKISTDNNSTINITGDARLYIEETLTLNNNVQLNLGSGVSVEMYIGQNISLENNSRMNYPGDPTKLGLYLAGTSSQTFANNSYVSASLYAPNSTILISNNGGFFGDVVAKKIDLSNNAMLHYDIALRSQRPPGDPGGEAEFFFLSWRKPRWIK